MILLTRLIAKWLSSWANEVMALGTLVLATTSCIAIWQALQAKRIAERTRAEARRDRDAPINNLIHNIEQRLTVISALIDDVVARGTELAIGMKYHRAYVEDLLLSARTLAAEALSGKEVQLQGLVRQLGYLADAMDKLVAGPDKDADFKAAMESYYKDQVSERKTLRLSQLKVLTDNVLTARNTILETCSHLRHGA